jgi:hypothetical protein
MKIHEYNEMMSYLTRPGMAYGGRIGLFRGSKGTHSKVSQTYLQKETQLINWLQSQIDKGKTRFNVGLEGMKKLSKTSLRQEQFDRVLKRNFPNTFVYANQRFVNLPLNLQNKIIELSKTNPANEIAVLLKDELPPQTGDQLNNRSIKSFLKSKGIEPMDIVKGSKMTTADRTKLDNIIVDFFNKNPNIDASAYRISGLIKASNPQITQTQGAFTEFLKRAMDRLDIDKKLTQRSRDLFPEIEKLDKIIKQNKSLLTSNLSPEKKSKRLIQLFAEATGKSLDNSADIIGTRMKRLGKLYAGQPNRFDPDLYNKIKPINNFLNSPLQANLIDVINRTTKMSNIDMAKLLGLSKKEIDLVANTASMFRDFPFKVAGDHTDIRALMKDFSNYKKNFTRIEYIKDNLNQFKAEYDKKIIRLKKDAEGASPALKREILKQQTLLQNDFANKTGYRLGGFDINKNRITINPKTLRLPDLKNPYNETLQTAMRNFEKTGLPTDTEITKFKDIDKRFINAKNSNETLKILEYANKNPKIAQQSQYLKALQKVPKIGKIATAVMKGTAVAGAGVLGMSTLAQAAKPGQMPQGSPGQLSEDEEGLSLGEKAAIGAGAVAGAKPAWKYAVKPALKIMGAPAVGLGFAGTTIAGNLAEGKNIADAVVDPLAGMELLLPEIYRQLGSNITPKNVLSKILSLQILDKFPYAAKVGLASKIVRGMTPVGVGLTVAGGLKNRAINMVEQAETMSALEPNEEQQRLIEEYAAKDYRGYNQGGRVGFDEGSKPKSPGRRAFLKGITAVAALPIVGRFFKLGKVLEAGQYTGPAIEKIKGMPEWFPGLVKKLWNEGEDVTKQMAYGERQVVKRGTLEGGDDVDMFYSMDTGDVSIQVAPKKGKYETSSGAYNKEYELSYEKGLADETTKGKPPDEFKVNEMEGRADPEAMDVDWDVNETTVDEAMSDLTELEAFAKNKSTKQIHKKKGTKKKDVFPDYDPY